MKRTARQRKWSRLPRGPWFSAPIFMPVRQSLTRHSGEQNGFTLFEILIAVVLLGLISAMIYSVLNMSIRFADKGEEQLRAVAREQGVHNLIRRQVEGAYFDSRKRAILMSVSTGGDILRLATRSPLINRSAGLVMAFYRYDSGEDALYYGEKRDFFNVDYDEEYEPELDEMHLLTKGIGGFSATYEEEGGMLQLEFSGKLFEMAPRCMDLQQVQVVPGQTGLPRRERQPHR